MDNLMDERRNSSMDPMTVALTEKVGLAIVESGKRYF
jgi:hypothetical protein